MEELFTSDVVTSHQASSRGELVSLPDNGEVQEQKHRFGVTPQKGEVIPPHLRTSSVQVEPATPPKWMTYEEAEEREDKDMKAGNVRTETGERRDEVEIVRRGVKKERPAGKSMRLYFYYLG
jgi:hypothetical protein